MPAWRRLILSLSLLFANSLHGADFPQTEISNAQMRVKLYIPDVKDGFYRGTRFDWSGMIPSVLYDGHEYFGQWFRRVDAAVRDFSYEGSDIVASPATAAVGPVEEFIGETKEPLGYAEAKAGESFVKIGVGVLRKPDDAPYNSFRAYEIVSPGKWSTKRSQTAVTFVQEVSDSRTGWGYVYSKTIRLQPGKSEMIVDHVLRNVGTKPIATDVYDHNFLQIDHQQSGPDYTVTMPFKLQSDHPPEKELAELRGNQIIYLKQLQKRERVFFPIQGFGETAADYDIRIENSKSAAGLRIQGNRPLKKEVVWTIGAVLAVEPYISISANPGEEFTWRMSYTFYRTGHPLPN